MDGLKTMERRQDSERRDSKHQRNDLDHRYRKIGISAVAAAVRHQGQQYNTIVSRSFPYDRD